MICTHPRCDDPLHCEGASRFWYYRRTDWIPFGSPWLRWVPYLGSDEHERRTVVVAVPFAGYLVIALWQFRAEAQPFPPAGEPPKDPWDYDP